MSKMGKVILSGMVSNGLEWYSWALYAFTALTISKQFFAPDGDASSHLLTTYAMFAAGFVARPLGGIMFGIIGDKLGRRTALVLSIFMMAIPTGCIGLLPTYATIGCYAQYMLLFLLIMQGLSLGGAFSGAITFIVEHAPSNKRGFIGSSSIESLYLGFLTGSFVAWIFTQICNQQQYDSWGWRVPFLLGIPISFIGLYIRKHCEESATFATAKADGMLSKTPVRDSFTHEFKHIMQAIGAYVSLTMPFYLLSTYFIVFTQQTLGRSKGEALMLNMINMVILLITAPISAKISDHIGRRKVLLTAAFAYLFLSAPIFSLLLQPSFSSVLIAEGLFSIIVGCYMGPIPTLLVEIFPTRVRYTAMSLSYNISAVCFGGTAAYVCEWMVKTYGNSYYIAYYVMFCACISIVSLLFYKDRYKEELA